MPSSSHTSVETPHHYRTAIEKNGFTVIECLTCQYQHIFPLPSVAAVEEFYKNHFGESTPSPNFEDKRDTLVAETALPPGVKGRVLDVGCWEGDFLNLFPADRWERVGIEPHPEKSAIAEKKGMVVYQQVLEKIDLATLGKFHAVNLSFILEHLRDPRQLLEIIFNQILYPDGMVCVEVPNDFSSLQAAVVKTTGLEPWWVCVPDHLNYFNFDSLGALLRRIGYQVVATETSFPMELFLLMGDNYVVDPPLGRVMHQKRLAFENNLAKAGKNDLKRSLYQLLPKLNIGRSAIVFARKP